jgi:predicted nucleotidyltransferase
MAEEVRPTNDVDIIIELLTYKDYAAIDERLRSMGFENDIDSGIICRYKIQGVIVDVMPTGENVLNFSNRWYPDGFQNAIEYIIDDEITIKIFDVTYFIASKLEAFKGRGKNDGRTSTDFEDIVYVFENRRSVWNDMENVQIEVNKYLRNEFTNLMANPYFEDWIDAHCSYGSPPATYFIIEQLESFIANSKE